MILTNMFYEMKCKEKVANLYYGTRISCIPIPNKDTTKEKTKDHLIDVYNLKNSLQIHEKLIQEHFWNIIL